MKVELVEDREELARFLGRNWRLHLYELGDLDDFFRPYTRFYGLWEGDRLREVALLYSGGVLPVLLALSEHPEGAMRNLLEALLPFLPERFYAHLSGDLAEVLALRYTLESHGRHWKMSLEDLERLGEVDLNGVVPLARTDLPALRRLYEVAYPDNWFDPRTLDTGCTFGVWQDGRLVSVAGVHVVAPRYSVAALGNVATHPNYRGQGLGAKVCAALCRHLRARGMTRIGLNVQEGNGPAISLYEKLGFQAVALYAEYLAVVR